MSLHIFVIPVTVIPFTKPKVTGMTLQTATNWKSDCVWCIIILSDRFNRNWKYWTFHQKWEWKVITVIWINHALYGRAEFFWRSRDDCYDNQVTGMTLTAHTCFSWITFSFFKNFILSLQQTVLIKVNGNEYLQVLNTFSALVFKHSLQLSLLLLNVIHVTGKVLLIL